MPRSCSYLFVIAIALAAITPLQAQGSSDLKDRRDAARRLLAQFDQTLERIPEDKTRARHRLPDPYPNAVLLAQRVEQFVKDFPELPETNRVWPVLIKAHQRNWDVAGEIGAHLKAAQRIKTLARRLEHLEAAAKLEADNGGFPTAIAILEGLIKDKVAPSRDAAWKEQIATWKTRESTLQAKMRPFLATLLDAKAKPGARLLRQANRFARSAPRHPRTAEIYGGILRALAKLPIAQRVPQLDMLAFYFPDHDLGRGAMRVLYPELFKTGDYERALLYVSRLARGGDAAAARFAPNLSRILSTIASRKLDLPRNTKHTRSVDLEQRIGRPDEQLESLDRAKWFAEDYPLVPERKSFLFRSAREALSAFPDEALPELRKLLNDPAPWADREAAIDLMRDAAIKLDGEESWLSLLESQGKLVGDPGLKTKLGLERADILGRNDREEDAIEELRGLEKLVTSKRDRDAINYKIAQLQKKLDG